MVFDTTIRVDDLITIGGVLIAGIAAFTTLQNGQKSQVFRLRIIEKEMEKQTDILVILARQDERVKFLEEQVKSLKARMQRSGFRLSQENS